MFLDYLKLPKKIYILFISRIVNCSGNFVFPFITLLLTQTNGLSEKEAGFFVSLSILASTLGILIGGFLTDKFGRKKILVIFPFISSLCMLTCAFLGKSILVPYMLSVGIIFNSAAKPATNALILDLTTKEQRKASLALMYYATNVGTALGPLIAGFLFVRHSRILFIGDGITTLASVLLIFIFIDENYGFIKNDTNKNNLGVNKNSKMLITILLKYKSIILYSLIFGALNIIYIQQSFSVPLYINELFKPNGSQMYGSLSTVNCFTVLIFTVLITSIIKNKNLILNTCIVTILYAISFSLIFMSTKYYQLFLITFLYSIGEIVLSISSQFYIAENTPSNYRGRFNAMFLFIGNIGYALGPIMGGIYIGFYSIKTMYLFILSISSIILLLICILYVNEKISINKESDKTKILKN
jgi:MFS family permease